MVYIKTRLPLQPSSSTPFYVTSRVKCYLSGLHFYRKCTLSRWRSRTLFRPFAVKNTTFINQNFTAEEGKKCETVFGNF